jgi:hypothetical protein
LVTIEIEKLTFTNKPTPKSNGVLWEKTKLFVKFKNHGFLKFPFQLFLFSYLVMFILLFGCLSFLFLEHRSYGSCLYICKWLSPSFFSLAQFDFVLEIIAKLYVAITRSSLLRLWHLLYDQLLVLAHLTLM